MSRIHRHRHHESSVVWIILIAVLLGSFGPALLLRAERVRKAIYSRSQAATELVLTELRPT